MAWFECHEQVREEVKLQRLAELLKIPYAHAVGLAVCLWAYATGHYRNGDLSDLTATEIARACCYNGDVTLLHKALMTCRLLDADGHIHNWKKRGVKLLSRESKRVKAWRKRKRHGNVTETLLNASTQPNPTIPNQPNLTKRKSVVFTPPTPEELTTFAASIGYALDVGRFCDHYTANGWRIGGKSPMRDWRAAVRNWRRNEQEGRYDRPGASGGQRSVASAARGAAPGTESDRAERHRQLDALTETITND